jgi:guanylate kinase
VSSTVCTYYYVTREEFERMVANGEFVEHATVFGNSYGTSKRAIADQIQSGKDRNPGQIY